MIASQVHVVQALAFTTGCATIHGLQRHAATVTSSLTALAFVLGMLVLAGEVASMTPDEPTDAALLHDAGALDPRY